jgi:crotonobetainyl-CoA:carnitine CoA-transferase CaiB-like acyl-CoA transferase
MWQAMTKLLDRLDLMQLSAAERRAQEATLEALIAAWTQGQDADAAMTVLQRHGIAAGVVRLPGDLIDDPHLQATGFWRRLDRPFIGLHWQSSSAFREGPDPYPVRRVAPTLGQDNEAILCGCLGLSREDFEQLAARGVVGTVPKPRRAQSDQ